MSAIRFYGKDWGGYFTVYPVRTTKGRILIGCTPDGIREYCITISRWISERRAGRIVPASGSTAADPKGR